MPTSNSINALLSGLPQLSEEELEERRKELRLAKVVAEIPELPKRERVSKGRIDSLASEGSKRWARTVKKAFEKSPEGRKLQSARGQLERSLMPSATSIMVGMGAPLVSMGERLIGRGKQADEMSRVNAAIQQAAEERDPKGFAGALARGMRGTLQTVPPMVLAGATGGPYAAIGYFAVQEANEAITEGRDAGLKSRDLVSYAVKQGVIEGGVASIFQRVGLGGVEKVFGGKLAVSVGVKQAMKRAGILTAQELPEELLTELGHSVARATDKIDPNALSTENLTRVAMDTTIQTLMTMGLIESPNIAKSHKRSKTRAEITKFADEGKVPSRKRWKEWGLPVEQGEHRMQRKAAVQAMADGFRAEGQQVIQASIAEVEAEIEAMPEPGSPEAAQGVQEAAPAQPTGRQEIAQAEPIGPQEVAGEAQEVAFREKKASELVDEAVGGVAELPEVEGLAVQEAEQAAEEARPERKGFLKEEAGARPIDERLGGPARSDVVGDQVLRGAAAGEVDLSTGDPDTDRRTSIRPGVGKLSVKERLGGALKRTWHSVTRAQVHLPKEDQYVFAQETFRLLKAVPQMSVDGAIRTIVAITHPMGPKQMKLFEKALLVDNQLRSLKKDQGLRNGWKSREQVEGYKNKIDALVQTTPEVKAALEMRGRIVHETVGRLVQQGLLPEVTLENTQGYFHQQVTAIQEAKRRTLGRTGGLRKKKKSFMKARVEGKDLSDEAFDFNPSYIESESEWLADAFSELRKKQLLDGLIARYDITAEVGGVAEAIGITPEEYVQTRSELEFFTPVPGNIFYKAFGIPEKIGEQLQAEIIKSANLTKDQIRQVMAVGGKHRGVVMPAELVAQLEATEIKHEKHWLTELHDQAISAWKGYTLLNPKRIIGYNIRNFTGDMDAVLAGDPRILKRMPKAVQELIRYHYGGVALSPEMRLARDLGVVGAGFFGAEVAETSEMQIFRRLKPVEQRQLLRNPAKLYMEVVRPSVELRENILRYSAFLEYLDQIKTGTLTHYGAAKRATVETLADEMGPEVAAAHMSRELIGDYGNLTEAGEFLRRKLIPFWAFQEINLKRYPRLAINAIQSGEGRGRAAVIISAAASLRIGAMYGALWSWNNVFSPIVFGTDDEDDLNDYDKANPHIVLGRNPDGTTRIFRNVGALGDFLEWFGANEILSSTDELLAGQMSIGEVAWEATKAPLEKAIGSLRPDLKAGFELATGQSLFPSPFNPRSQERGVIAANVFGLSDEFKWMQGLAVGEGNRARRNYWQRWFIGVTDPRQAAMTEMYDARRRFLKMKGVSEGGVYPVSEYKQARDAASNEDYEAFVQWKDAFVARHGRNSWRKFKAFQRRLDPIASRLNEQDEREFRYEYLTPDQRRKQQMVEDYAAELYVRLSLWWTASEQAEPRK